MLPIVARPQDWLPDSRRLAPSRFDTTPWTAMAQLEFTNGGAPRGIATAFLITGDVLLTARHNFELAQPFDGINVRMGFDGRQWPTPAIAARAYAFHRVFDVGVLVIPAQTARAFTLEPDPPSTVKLAGYGYPSVGDTLTYGEGPLTACDPDRLGYRIGAIQGDSGGPVFSADSGLLRAHAVHSQGAANAEIGNYGVRLTRSLVNDIQTLAAYARSQIAA